MRRARTFRAGFDRLESREVQSGLHATAAMSHAILLRGMGTIAPTGVRALSDGGLQTTGNLTGSSPGLGQISGQFTNTIAPDSIHASGSGEFVAQNGDRIELAYTGTYRRLRPHSARSVALFTFNVTSGTGAFANATGAGTITAADDLAADTHTFAIRGRLRE